MRAKNSAAPIALNPSTKSDPSAALLKGPEVVSLVPVTVPANKEEIRCSF